MPSPLRYRDTQWYGSAPDHPDQRDHIYKSTAAILPATVDLRSHCPPVMDQGALGSCTAHGITGALRYNTLKAGKKDVPLARLQLYYDERSVEGTITSDSGAMIRDGIKCAAKLGVAPESSWPYNIKNFKKKPSPTVYKAALKDKALTYARVNVATADLKAALASGEVVVIGFTVYASFENDAVAANGIVPMPANNEEVLGGHCVYVVGYEQKPGYFTCRNSWNVDWGDKGDFYMPYAYLGSPTYGSDYWVINTVGA